jgi:integrase
MEIADAVLPGLYLVVQPSGVRSFAVRTRINGKPAKLTIGRWPLMDLASARETARAKLQAVGSGVDPRQAERRAKAEARQAEEQTVRAVTEEWFRRDQAGNRDIYRVRRIMDREVLPTLGDMEMVAVRKRDLIILLDRIADRAPIRANRTLAAVKRLFNWAASRDLIELNPAAFIEKPAPEIRRDRVLGDCELAAVWHAACRVGGPYGAGILLLTLTGARLSEIFEARWSEIDEKAGVLRLPAARSKSKEGRSISLSEQADGVLCALPRFAGCDWIITASGQRPFKAVGTSKLRLDAALAGPISPWRVHDIRRSVATGLQRLGVRLETIEAVLGHRSGSRSGIVGTYQRHRFDAEARQALDLWGRHITRITSGKTAEVIELRNAAR